MDGAEPSRREVERWLSQAEAYISLSERSRPRNWTVELGRVRAAWTAGCRIVPRWEYPPAPDLSRLAAALEELGAALESAGAWSALYGARARELGAAARVVRALGTPDCRVRAAELFVREPDETFLRAAEWARIWSRAVPPHTSQPRAPADDANDPRSLVSVLKQTLGELRLPYRVEIRRNLAPLAATGDGVIAVRAGEMLDDQEVRRVVLHEVVGHALPRVQATRQASALYAVGFAGGSSDEEGRALYLEKQAGFLDERRQAELGWRHLGAEAVLAGASWHETVDLLLEAGALLPRALEVAARCHRGGGLGREIVYLPALVRYEQALASGLSLEPWFQRGRVSVRAVPVLAVLGDPPQRLAVAAATSG